MTTWPAFKARLISPSEIHGLPVMNTPKQWGKKKQTKKNGAAFETVVAKFQSVFTSKY